MEQLNKKQMIMIGIGIVIIFTTIFFYINTKESKTKENLLIPYEETEEKVEGKESTDSKDGIVVYITGAIQQEGVYELKSNSRIADVIEKAGGINEDANIDELNLACPLEDGMKIYIPTKEEVENRKKMELEENHNLVRGQSNQLITKNETIEKGKQSQEKKTNKVNINTATQTELETLPGIGPSTALKIINYRKEKGKFSKIEEIQEVSGIGENKYSQIKELIAIK